MLMIFCSNNIIANDDDDSLIDASPKSIKLVAYNNTFSLYQMFPQLLTLLC